MINTVKSIKLSVYFIFFLLVIHIIYNFIKRTLSKPQILGFQINGIGNGHLTQAETIYKILIKNYKIPIVIIYGRKTGYDNIFSQSKVIYYEISSTNESINHMNLLKAIKDITKKKNTYKYENEYQINKWFNFYMVDLYNSKTKQINIASQFSVNNIKNHLLVYLTKLLTNTIIVSIHLPSKHSKYVIPPLINLKKLERKNINKKLLLSYSVSGREFPKRLNYVAKQNLSYQFKYFTNTNIKEELSKNITIYKPDKIKFYKYLEICGGVLCTSGNELVIECIFNKIPCAIMPCSNKQFEQIHNMEKYVKNLNYCDYFHDSLDLEYLINKNMKDKYLDLMCSLKDRDKKILKLVHI